MSTVPSWPSSRSQLQHALKSLLSSVHKFHELGQQPVKTEKKIQSTPGNIMKNELENYKRQALLVVSGYCLKFE